MRRDYRYEEPAAHDRLMCSRFGAGAFPCGPVVKIRVLAAPSRPGGPDHERRTALCQAHYTFDVTKTGISGGASGFKARAKAMAAEHLAAAHPLEFQDLYESALRSLCASTSPPIDPDVLLGRSSTEAAS